MNAAISSPHQPELLGQTVVVIGGSAGSGLETARGATWNSHPDAALVARHAANKVRPGGTLLFISGTGGRRPTVGFALISALTATGPAMTKNLALELAPVRLNLIAAGFVGRTLGYTADLAVSDDHLIVAARVTQNATDNASLVPMVDEVERRCGQRPQKVTGDSGLFSGAALHEMKRRGIDLYVPDNNLRHEMQTGKPAAGIGRCTIRDPEHLQLREKLRSP